MYFKRWSQSQHKFVICWLSKFELEQLVPTITASCGHSHAGHSHVHTPQVHPPRAHIHHHHYHPATYRMPTNLPVPGMQPAHLLQQQLQMSNMRCQFDPSRMIPQPVSNLNPGSCIRNSPNPLFDGRGIHIQPEVPFQHNSRWVNKLNYMTNCMKNFVIFFDHIFSVIFITPIF